MKSFLFFFSILIIFIFFIQVEKALKSTQQILNLNKNLIYFDNTSHSWDDKFTLVENLINIASHSHFKLWKLMGITEEISSKLPHNQSIILRFSSIRSSKLLKEESHEVPKKRKKGKKRNLFTRTKTKLIYQYYWNFDAISILSICSTGEGKENCIILKNFTKTVILTTATDSNPGADYWKYPHINLDVTWFFRKILNQSQNFTTIPSFSINRTDVKCFTPVHNQDTLLALDYFDSVIKWSGEILHYHRDLLHNVDHIWNHLVNEKSIQDVVYRLRDNIYIPILPITKQIEEQQIEEDDEKEETTRSTLFLNPNELNQCLLEEQRALEIALMKIEEFMSEISYSPILSTDHAKNLLLFHHLNDVSRYLVSGVVNIDEMLIRQLYKAIGRHVTIEDIDEYMTFRNQQLFLPEFQPQPMIYAIRRSSSHSPEGVMSLEKLNNSPLSSSPVLHTIVRKEFMKSSKIIGNSSP